MSERWTYRTNMMVAVSINKKAHQFIPTDTDDWKSKASAMKSKRQLSFDSESGKKEQRFARQYSLDLVNLKNMEHRELDEDFQEEDIQQQIREFSRLHQQLAASATARGSEASNESFTGQPASKFGVELPKTEVTDDINLNFLSTDRPTVPSMSEASIQLTVPSTTGACNSETTRFHEDSTTNGDGESHVDERRKYSKPVLTKMAAVLRKSVEPDVDDDSQGYETAESEFGEVSAHEAQNVEISDTTVFNLPEEGSSIADSRTRPASHQDELKMNENKPGEVGDVDLGLSSTSKMDNMQQCMISKKNAEKSTTHEERIKQWQISECFMSHKSYSESLLGGSAVPDYIDGRIVMRQAGDDDAKGNLQISQDDGETECQQTTEEIAIEIAAIEARNVFYSPQVNPITYRIPGQYTIRDMVLGHLTPREYLHRIRRLELADDDVIIASYPQRGTTPIEQLIYLIHHTDDIEMSQVCIKLPILDHSFPDGINGIELFEESAHPRLLRTYLPYQCIPRHVEKGVSKCIYIMRNPKDVLVDLYHMYKSETFLGKFQGLWNDFFELVLSNNVYCGDLFYHYLSWWFHRGQRNVLIVNLEDIVRDRRQMVENIASFCNQVISSTTIDRIAEAISNVNGQSSSWKKFFTVEQNEIFDELMHKRLVESGLDLFLNV